MIRLASQTGFPLCAAEVGLAAACHGRAPSLHGAGARSRSAVDSTATGVALVEICELPE